MNFLPVLKPHTLGNDCISVLYDGFYGSFAVFVGNRSLCSFHLQCISYVLRNLCVFIGDRHHSSKSHIPPRTDVQSHVFA
jgi:hypothetical protein